MKILTADGSYIKSQIIDVERSELERKNREAEVQFMYIYDVVFISCEHSFVSASHQYC